MFNRTFVVPGRDQHHYHRSEHHEHRAPTDESVRLLKEFEEKAEAKRIASLQMPGNSFNGVVEVLRDDASAQRTALAVFTLNGVRCTAKVSDDWHGEPGDLLRKLRDETARVIASQILPDMAKGLKL